MCHWQGSGVRWGTPCICVLITIKWGVAKPSWTYFSRFVGLSVWGRCSEEGMAASSSFKLCKKRLFYKNILYFWEVWKGCASAWGFFVWFLCVRLTGGIICKGRWWQDKGEQLQTGRELLRLDIQGEILLCEGGERSSGYPKYPKQGLGAPWGSPRCPGRFHELVEVQKMHTEFVKYFPQGC